MSIEHYDPKFIENNPWQTRQREPDAEYIKDLAADIKKNGLLQVPMGRIVNTNGAAHVQLAFGHNRLRAYLHLDLALMPVDVRTLSDEQMAAFAWSENEKRWDVTALERAYAIDKRIKDFGWTNRQCAEHLGIDHSTVSNILRLLKLPEDVQQYLLEGKLTERQAEAMLPIYDTPESVDRFLGPWSYRTNQQHITIQNFAEIVVKAGWSSDVIRDVVNSYFNFMSLDLKDAEFKLDQMFTEGGNIYCGLCKTCDKRMPSRNLCFSRLCFEAKTEMAHQDYLQQASFVLRYPVDDPTKGGYPTQLPTYSWEKANRETIIASKCPSLVLIYRKEAKIFEAFPNVDLVCTKRNNSCTCIKGLQEMSKEPYNAADHYSEVTDIDEDDQTEEEEENEGEAEDISLKPTEEKVISSSELEEVARQARRKKMEVSKTRGEIRSKLAARLLDDLNKMEPGAFYLATIGFYPGRGELSLNNIFALLAANGAQRVINDVTEWNSIDDLMKYVNQALEKLNMAPFTLEEMKPVPVQVEEVTIPIF